MSPWKVDSSGRENNDTKNERKCKGESWFILINKQSWHHHSNTKKVALAMSIYCESFSVPMEKEKKNMRKRAHKSKMYTIITKRTETWRRNNCLELETRKINQINRELKKNHHGYLMYTLPMNSKQQSTPHLCSKCVSFIVKQWRSQKSDHKFHENKSMRDTGTVS